MIVKKLSNGVDIVEVGDFRKYPLSSKFITKLFRKKELEYCLKKNDPYPHLASRFAAKEAVCKAFGNLDISIPILDVEIIKKEGGPIETKIHSHRSLESDFNITLSIIVYEI